MSTRLKAIETSYRGYAFRSRIEARWAIFFDTLGLKWDYEPEGYDLAGTYYLPDFWVPSLSAWVEIKGKRPSKDEEEKARLLALFSKKWVYLFFGDVSQEECEKRIADGAYVYRYWPERETVTQDHSQLWCECPHCGRIGVAFGGRSDRLLCKQCVHCARLVKGISTQKMLYDAEALNTGCPAHGFQFDISGCPRIGPTLDEGYNFNTRRIQEARTAARAARFEHGEAPKITNRRRAR